MEQKIILAILLLSAPLMADWKVKIDKKANEITGVRNAYAVVGAKGMGTADLVIGCTDKRPIMRVVSRFQGFRVTGSYGSYFSFIKLRAGAATEYVEAQAPAVLDSGAMVLLLDNWAQGLLPAMRTSDLLFAQVTYSNDKQSMVRFPMAGLDAALAKMADVGCQPW